jgi:RNA polymerase sigma-70 factor (ECF subfamily)
VTLAEPAITAANVPADADAVTSIPPRLPEDQRTALELRYLQGMSVGEVGRRMGRGTPSVANLLYRGLKALRERLSDETGTGSQP